MSNPEVSQPTVRFIEGLRRTQNDRGKMASMRRGLSQATVMDAWPVVASIGGEIGQPGESVHVDIAALFATHPRESDARDFGETCRQIALAGSSDRILPESHERRFRRLLACEQAGELSAQLRTWIRLAASKGVGVNYISLFDDLASWNTSSDRIRVQWARSFWKAIPESEALTATAIQLQPATA